MRRREFITLLGGAVAAWPLAARAQQRGKVWRIGFLAGGSRPVSSDFHPYAGFLRGMRELGYVEGKEFIVEWRFAEGRFQIFPDLAAELVSLNVDVIVLGTPTAIPAAQHATRTTREVLFRDKSQDCRSTRAGHPSVVACGGRRGDRMTKANCSMSLNLRVILRKSRIEHIWSGFPQIATVNADIA
jgi:hypothetical protein